MEELKQGKKSKTWVFVLIIVLLLAVIGVLVYVLLNPKKEEEPAIVPKEKDEIKEEIKEEIAKVEQLGLEKEDASSYTARLKVYGSEDGNYFCEDYGDKNYCNVVALSIPVENENAKVMSYYSNVYVFYKDGSKIKLYNALEKQSYIVKISGDYYEYSFLTDEDTQALVGVAYKEKENDKMSFYSTTLGKVLYDKKYDRIFGVNGKYIMGSDEKCEGNYSCVQEKMYLLDVNEEKVYLSKETDGSYYAAISNDKGSFMTIMAPGSGKYYEEIYDAEFRVFAKGEGDTCIDGATVDIASNGNLLMQKGNVVEEYDKNGKLVKTSKKYDKIMQVISDYIVIIKDNKVIMANMDGDEVAIGPWKKTYDYHSMLSGWYTENGKHGIYLVIGNSELEVGQKGSGYEYYFIPTTKEVGIIETDGVGDYAKPILYLYPTKKTNVKVEFKNKDILTTTYPKYENSWEVVASPNGDLYDKNGKYYYALYWEENSNHKVDFKEGFYVTDDNAIEFLESSLSQLGFSDKEANEFIMYWLPILEKNGKSLVYFEQTLEREKYSPIKITPKPDSVLRVAMHVKKVNKKESIKKQKLETFKRSGFTAVEWGGVVY